MVLGASSYTFAEATDTQSAADFIDATVHGFEYYGCVPEIMVPDQLRAAVTGPDPRSNPQPDILQPRRAQPRHP